MLPYKDPEKRKKMQKKADKKYKETHRKELRKKRKKERDEIRRTIKEEKDKPCKKCKKRFIPKAMDFHHRNRKTKKFNISNATKMRVSIKALLREIKKCDLVCKNCHAEIEEKIANNNSD